MQGSGLCFNDLFLQDLAEYPIYYHTFATHIIFYFFIFISMNNGTVKFYDEIKGFGFIKDANSSKEYFVHSSGIIDRIRDNDEVTFDLQEGRKGLNAVNVRRS
jgi:cold shock protein